ncbi:MAG: mechanosensitive ion channel family protein [Acidimicrobiia bacterium]|nr:mechanosensitive ion channel family protein [Acidimicrobiia bacterium]
MPVATVWDEPIENSTTLGGRRTKLAVGVGYSSDLDQAQTVLLEAAASVEGVRDEPMSQALVNEFGDSSVNVAVRFRHDPDKASEWEVRDRLARTMKKRLDAAGIEIPFPQLVQHRDFFQIPSRKTDALSGWFEAAGSSGGVQVVRGLGGITVIVDPEPERDSATEFELVDPRNVFDFLGSL